MTNSIASIASESVPLPLASKTFEAMMLAVQFTPTTPRPLLPTAPIVPETCVPWPLSSAGLQENAIALNPCEPAGHVIVLADDPEPQVTVKAVGAVHMLAARSGCEYSTPVSMTPTTLFVDPVVMSQALVAWMSAPG